MCTECDWKSFVSQAEDVIAEAEDIPTAGAMFAASVQKKLGGMVEWAKDNKHATEKMFDAVVNMRDGVEKWTSRR